MGYKGSSGSWDASAALVKAILIASSQPPLFRAAPEAPPHVLAGLDIPNLYSCYGRPALLRALGISDISLAQPVEKRCSCNGNNSLLFESAAAVNRDISSAQAIRRRYGADYGNYCAPWNRMTDGREQRCDNIAAANAADRAAASGGNESVRAAAVAAALAADLGVQCCQAWCFVSCDCVGAQPFRPPGAAEPVNGLCASRSVCSDVPDDIIFCPWAHFESGLGTGSRSFIKDHSTTEGGYNPSDLMESVNPAGGALAEGESVEYVMAIVAADSARPLVVTLVWTGKLCIPALIFSFLVKCLVMMKVLKEKKSQFNRMLLE